MHMFSVNLLIYEQSTKTHNITIIYMMIVQEDEVKGKRESRDD